jgi:hypothetical protein
MSDSPAQQVQLGTPASLAQTRSYEDFGPSPELSQRIHPPPHYQPGSLPPAQLTQAQGYYFQEEQAISDNLNASLQNQPLYLDPRLLDPRLLEDQQNFEELMAGAVANN